MPSRILQATRVLLKSPSRLSKRLERARRTRNPSATSSMEAESVSNAASEESVLVQAVSEGSDTAEDNPAVKPPSNRCPIARLPPELLAHIFHLLSALSPPYDYGPWRRPSRSLHLRLISVTHVCRFWREVALLNSTLWCDISDHLGTRFLEEQLVRSKSSPISWCIDTYLQPRQIALLSQHMFHLGSLQVAMDYEDRMDEILESALSQPAPLLQHFEIEGTYSREGEPLKALPSSFCTPRLRRLNIRSAVVPWLLPDLTKVTELEVKFPPHCDPFTAPSEWVYSSINGTSVSTCSMFYDTLRRMPSLRTLHLLDCLPIPSRIVAAGVHGVAEMPFLQQVCLSGEAFSCRQVLSYIKIPQTCELILQCKLGRGANMDDLEFVFYLLSRYSRFAEYEARVSFFSHASLRLAVRESLLDNDHKSLTGAMDYRPGSVGPTDVSIMGRDPAVMPARWCASTLISRLSKAIPAARVHTLALEWMNFRTYRQFHDTLNLFPNVQHLSATTVAAIFLITAGTPVAAGSWSGVLGEDETSTVADVLSLPGLQTLSFRSVDFTKEFAEVPLQAALLKALIRRKSVGLPIRELLLIQCQMEAEWVEAFEYVIRVSLEGRD